MRSRARSRPRTITRSLDAAAIAVRAAPGLPISMGDPPAVRTPRFPLAAKGCSTIVGQYQRGGPCQTPPLRRGRSRDSRGPAPPAHGATVAFIVERLREDILAGRLPPGSRLVECDLTSRFGVSRGPVREALRRLSADGLIEHWPHRGAVVRRLTEREIRELFLIRIEMEALAARLAATADAPDRRERFAAAIQPIYAEAARNPCEYLKENAAFHDAVMALADNLQLRELAARLQLPLIMAQVGDVLTPAVLEASVREHRAIARAILERDPGAASARMRAHLERAAALALASRPAAQADAARRSAAPAPARGRSSAGSP